MINLLKIEDMKNRLVEALEPKKIYIFGSYAWGSPKEDSDLDIMILLDKCGNKILETRKALKSLRKIGFSKDIIVESEEEFLLKSQENYLIEKEIKDRGYLLYEKTN